MKNKPVNRSIKQLAMVFCLGSLGISSASAATRTWLTAVDGDFTDSTKWSSSLVPGSADLAFFNTANYTSGSKFTVTLTGSPITNQNFRLTGANAATMNFNLNGGSYTTTLTGSGDSRVGDGDGVVVLNLYGGGSFNAGNLNIGHNSVSNGTVNISGSTTSLNVSAASAIGSAGIGNLNVSAGGKYSSTAAITIANSATTGFGNVKVSGTDSKFDLTSTSLIVGAGGTASLIIENGGQLVATGANSTAFIRFSTSSTGSSTALITGTDSKLEGGNIDIGGNASSVQGTSAITVSNGGSFAARGAMQLWNTSSFLIDGGHVSSGGNFTAYAGSEIGFVLSDSNTVPYFEVGNNLTLTGSAVTLNLSLGTTPAFNVNDTVLLFGYDGTLSGAFSNYTEGQVFQLGDYDFQFSYALTSGADTFIGLTVLNVIPEPSTAWLLGIGIAAVLGRRKLVSRR